MTGTAADYMADAHKAGVRRIWRGWRLSECIHRCFASTGYDQMDSRSPRSARGIAAALSASHRPAAVCAGSCNPGNLHLITGSGAAQPRSSAGDAAHIPSTEVVSDYLSDIRNRIQSAGHHVELVSDPEQLRKSCSARCE